ncbi:hypothetical protein KGF54_004805 [Candida jiufengensis]|uniref:uncharacterized protein n=1 Tax=Candida jiufengensis TaxID=497108 RepID=UPI002224D9AA|nr:uncharacterized protein KGF54_004805 [Candida jiufengensis]KAI5951730.1 hypothetical protein KGF54_004805 [Candida jiufengensis]
MSKITITNRSSNKESPFTEENLINILNKIDSNSPNEIIEKLSDNLDNISSKHKIIIQYTAIEGKQEISNLKINTGFTSNWDASKDGCLTLSIDLNESKSQSIESVENSEGIDKESEIPNNSNINSLLITIYWISV